MIMHFKIYIFSFIILSNLSAQFFHSPLDVASAGSYLGGRLGTHSIHSNPALLGLKPNKLIEMVSIDTFDIIYTVRLTSSKDENEIIDLEKKLIRDGFVRDFTIDKIDSLFFLNTSGFVDTFSAYNFSKNLPSLFSDHKIIADTTYRVYEKPKVQYRVQIFAHTNKDTLKSFIKNIDMDLEGVETKSVFKDSIYKFYLGNLKNKQEAYAFRDSPAIKSISQDAFVLSDTSKMTDNQVPQFSMTFPLRFAMNMGSNRISTDWINGYIGADMVKYPMKKTNLLNSIPSSGINGFFSLNGGSLDMTFRNFGLSLLNIDAHFRLNIPKDLTKIIFDGIRFEEPVKFSDLDFKGLVVNSTTLSFGKRVEIEKIPFPFYIGGGFRYLLGTFSYIESYEGEIATIEDSVNLFSDINLVYSNTNQLASGIGIDFGVYGQINEKLSTQFSIIGLGGSLNSSKNKIWKSKKEIRISSEDLNEFSNFDETQMDSLNNEFSIQDETTSIGTKSISVPSRVNLASNYILTEEVHLKGAIQYLIQTEFIGSVDIKTSIGLELFPNKVYPLLFGVSLGGLSGTTFGGGLTLKLGKVHINIGGSQSGGIGNSATGFSLSSEMRLVF